MWHRCNGNMPNQNQRLIEHCLGVYHINAWKVCFVCRILNSLQYLANLQCTAGWSSNNKKSDEDANDIGNNLYRSLFPLVTSELENDFTDFRKITYVVAQERLNI